MATKKGYPTFNAIMAMNEDAFHDFVIANGHAEQIKKIAVRYTEQKVYPKVLKPMKFDKKHPERYNPDKLTYQADRSKKPTVVVKPITFFEIKSCYCEEVLLLAKVEKEPKETIRNRMMNW